MAIDYKEKIKKLLALSESSNEHEARAALLKARQLMMEHNIFMPETEECDDRIMEAITKATFTLRKNPWIYDLGEVISENHRCEIFTYRPYKSRTRTIAFIGHPEDVKMCNEVFLYALDCILSKEKEIHKAANTTAQKTSLFNNYGMGFVKGLKTAYQEQNKEYGWGLVASVPDDVKKYLKDNTEAKTNKIQGPDTSSAAYMLGASDGKEFDKTKRIS